jgi:hypothetical protein
MHRRPGTAGEMTRKRGEGQLVWRGAPPPRPSPETARLWPWILPPMLLYWAAGSASEPNVLRQLGWPKPLAQTPVPPFGFGAISKMILSG